MNEQTMSREQVSLVEEIKEIEKMNDSLARAISLPLTEELKPDR